MKTSIVSKQGEPPIGRLRSQISAGLLIFSAVLALGTAQLQAAPRPNNISIIPTVTSIVVNNGQLLASGNATAVIRGHTTTVPFNGVPVILALATNQPGIGACPVLDLMLGPINLDLLGLVVETSPICLQITAFENGGLLGDLLCSVANLLNGGLTLSQILAGQGLPLLPGLTTAQLNTLLAGVQSILNGALGNLLQAVVTAVLPGATPLVCSVLHLELGPVSLNLLGLQVDLDNCADGPVVVDITAVRGPGNLLGNLLCGSIAGPGSPVGTTLQSLLSEIVGLLNL